VSYFSDQVSSDSDNQIEIIELACILLAPFDDHEVLEAQWRRLENVLDEVGFRNKLKEVRMRLSVNSWAMERK
jgi:hypothetical protein